WWKQRSERSRCSPSARERTTPPASTPPTTPPPPTPPLVEHGVPGLADHELSPLAARDAAIATVGRSPACLVPFAQPVGEDAQLGRQVPAAREVQVKGFAHQSTRRQHPLELAAS